MPRLWCLRGAPGANHGWFIAGMLREASEGCVITGPVTAGQPVITVACSRSIRSSAVPASKRSIPRIVAPTCIADTDVNEMPPTQKSGIPQ
jgi:hypothetical protein